MSIQVTHGGLTPARHLPSDTQRQADKAAKLKAKYEALLATRAAQSGVIIAPVPTVAKPEPVPTRAAVAKSNAASLTRAHDLDSPSGLTPTSPLAKKQRLPITPVEPPPVGVVTPRPEFRVIEPGDKATNVPAYVPDIIRCRGERFKQTFSVRDQDDLEAATAEGLTLDAYLDRKRAKRAGQGSKPRKVSQRVSDAIVRDMAFESQRAKWQAIAAANWEYVGTSRTLSGFQTRVSRNLDPIRKSPWQSNSPKVLQTPCLQGEGFSLMRHVEGTGARVPQMSYRPTRRMGVPTLHASGPYSPWFPTAPYYLPGGRP